MYINKKVELNLTKKQKEKINYYMYQAKFIQNLYIKANTYSYEINKNKDNKNFISAFTFKKFITKYKKTEEGKWLKTFPTSALSTTLKDIEVSYKKMFKEGAGKPKYKGKNDRVSLYFCQTDKKGKYLAINKNAIKFPKIGWLCLKRNNYLPTENNEIIKAKSGRITKSPTGKYYVSVMIELPDDYFYDYDKPYSEPLGIDLGVKDTAILSNGTKYGNINKTEKIRREEKHLKHLQRDLSRKYEARKKEWKSQPKSEKKIITHWYKPQLRRIKEITKNHTITFNKPKQVSYIDTPAYAIDIQTYDLINAQDKVRYIGEKMTMSNNWYKTKLKVAKLHERLTNQRNYYQDQIVSDIVKLKPMYITLEDLNISGMMKNKHMAKAISQQKLYELKTKLIAKCNQHGIEVREVDRFYPSSQICSECGEQYKWLGCENKNQILKVREWECPCCHAHHDRDINASINLRNATEYKVLTDCELGCAYKNISENIN